VPPSDGFPPLSGFHRRKCEIAGTDPIQDFGGEVEGRFHGLIVSGDTIGGKVDSSEGGARKTENVDMRHPTPIHNINPYFSGKLVVIL
jgi:hypothetical protein